MKTHLTKEDIERRLFELNSSLAEKGVNGEIGIFGGAMMVLAFNSRKSTKDIDAIFRPSSEIRAAAADIAAEHGMNENWLNDGVKGYIFVKPRKIPFMELSNLKIWLPPAEYMLAMKCCSGRFDSNDEDDIRTLIKQLGLNSGKEVFKIIEEYSPRKRIPPKAQFLVEEIFEKIKTSYSSYGKPYQSRLLPYMEEIKRLRKKDTSYREIAEYLKENYGLTVNPATIFNFVKVRSHPRKVKYKMI